MGGGEGNLFHFKIMELIYNIHQLEMTETKFPAPNTHTKKKSIERGLNASSENEPLRRVALLQTGGTKERC